MAKADAGHLDSAQLIGALGRQIGLAVTSLTFVPSWEGSCYVAADQSGRRLLVKAFDPDWRPAHLEAALAAAHVLANSCGLKAVAPPLRLANGSFVLNVSAHAVTIFEFVIGASLADENRTGRTEAECAQFVRALHEAGSCPAFQEIGRSLPCESFSLGFEDRCDRVLDAARRTTSALGADAREAASLIKSAIPHVAWFRERLGRIRHDQSSFVPTHGDLNPSNFLRESGGRLRVIDWSKLMMAPRERDLSGFAYANFPTFLEEYMQRQPRPILRLEHFEYYLLRETLAGVVDYGSLLLLEESSVEDRAHALSQLKGIFPIEPQVIEARLAWIAGCIAGLAQ